MYVHRIASVNDLAVARSEVDQVEAVIAGDVNAIDEYVLSAGVRAFPELSHPAKVSGRCNSTWPSTAGSRLIEVSTHPFGSLLLSCYSNRWTGLKSVARVGM